MAVGAWYRTGTINVTNGSLNIVGVDTLWLLAGVKTGHILIGPDGGLYEIANVTAETGITLNASKPYQGATLSGQNYAIVMALNNTTNADLAARLSTLVQRWQNREDEFVDWTAGTPTGGANSDGKYPLTDALNNVQQVTCPAKLASDVNSYLDDLDSGARVPVLAALNAQIYGITNAVDVITGTVADDDDPDWPKKAKDTSHYQQLTADGDNLGAGTTTEKNALSPSYPDIFYDTTLGKWQQYSGSVWADTTRGCKRQWPAEFAIAASATKVNIYDLTDNGALWRSHDFTGKVITSIAYKNGQLWVATTTGLYVYNFANDTIDHTAFDYTTTTTPAIINNSVNDVAITLLDDAPIDPVSGMRIPTIFAACGTSTTGGISRINSDGTVTSDASVDGYPVVEEISIDESTQRAMIIHVENSAANGRRVSVIKDITADTLDYQYYSSRGSDIGGPYVSTYISTVGGVYKNNCVAAHNGVYALKGGSSVNQCLAFLCENPSVASNGMSALIATDYNTGWMHNTVGAWINSTDTGTIAATSELVTNGTFDADTNWTKGTGWTISAGVASSDGTQSADSLLTTSTIPATVAGEVYVVEFEVTAYTAGNVALKFDGVEVIADKAATGLYNATVTASDTTGTIDIVADLNFVGSVDNVKLRKAIPDRSVKNHGAKIYSDGGLTLTALGGEGSIAALSGISATNFLEVPYHSDYDFGTDDFIIQFGFENSGNTTEEILYGYGYYSSGWPGSSMYIRLDATTGYIRAAITDDGFTSSDVISTTTAFGNGNWHNGILMRVGGSLYLYVDNVLVGSVAITNAAGSLTNPNGTILLGRGHSTVSPNPFLNGSLALFRISIGNAATQEAIEYMHHTEKKIIDGQACVLPGTSDSVLGFSDSKQTGLIHGSTSTHEFAFSDLVRVRSNASQAGTLTGIAAHGETVIQAGATVYAEVPEKSLRDELSRRDKVIALSRQGAVPRWFDDKVTNGAFGSDISGWSDYSIGSCSIAWNASGYLDLTAVDASNRGVAQQQIKVDIGAKYVFQAFHVDADDVAWSLGNTHLGYEYGTELSTVSETVSHVFIATKNDLYIVFGGRQYPGTSSVDNVRVMDADPDDLPCWRLPAGYKPVRVEVENDLYREGATHDYVVKFDGFIYYVTPATFPAIGADVRIEMEVV